ncbi:MAG: hypothetical protein K2X38_24935 [Gemmataceae bacterium]|nr:hypothetical protein [Gemmataceae bacterium]
MALTDLLEQHSTAIAERLFVGFAGWDDLVARVRAEELSKTRPCYCDEQVWTFLVGCGYAAASELGVKALTNRAAGRPRLADAPQPQDLV